VWYAGAALAALVSACGEPSRTFSPPPDAALDVEAPPDRTLTPDDFGAPPRDVPQDTACVGRTVVATRTPIDILVMLDRSGSMLFPTAAGRTKWDAVTDALTDFLRAPSSAGLGVGLQFFPLNVPGVPDACTASSQCGTQGPCVLRVCQEAGNAPCTTNADCTRGVACIDFGWCRDQQAFGCFPIGGTACMSAGGPGGPCVARSSSYCRNAESCDVSLYAAPDVDVAELPSASARLLNSIAAHRPAGISSTPTWPALQGVVNQARARDAADPRRKVAVVFATDGLPSGRCEPRDIASIARVARDAFTQTPPIPVFVVGVFADTDTAARSNLDQIAAAGGTRASFITGVGADTSRRLSEALDSIRTTTVACEYQVPTPAGPDLAVDFNRVNVEFTSAAGVSTVPYVSSPDRCSESRGGWHYDVDPRRATPTRITLCAETCRVINQVSGAQVDIRVGCQTVPL
jgi:hypothetical protein